MSVLELDSYVRLVRLRTAGGEPIDAVLTEPPSATPIAAVIHLHGKGGNFYTGPGRFLPRLTGDLPITHLSINMVCHDLAYTRYDLPSPDFSTSDVPVGGGYWEQISRGHLDVAAAVEFLRERGHERIFLSGHSSGGFYAVDYAVRDKNLAGIVLLSPLTSNRTVLPRWFPTEGQLSTMLEKAARMIADGCGRHLIPLTSWYYAISAEALVERALDSEGGWERRLAESTCPVLMMWGDLESRSEAWEAVVNRIERPNLRAVVLHGCEHHFVGFEGHLARAMSEFTRSVYQGQVCSLDRQWR